MVDLLHRHLKPSLRARLDCPNWMGELHWVLLGVRRTPKEDLGCCSVELVYRSTIIVPGDFFGNPTPDPNLLQLLGTKGRDSNPFQAPQQTVRKESVLPDLAKATHVFIPHNVHCLQLRKPYRVLTLGNKTFTMQVSTMEETISVDRLKPECPCADGNTILLAWAATHSMGGS